MFRFNLKLYTSKYCMMQKNNVIFTTSYSTLSAICRTTLENIIIFRNMTLFISLRNILQGLLILNTIILFDFNQYYSTNLNEKTN